METLTKSKKYIFLESITAAKMDLPCARPSAQAKLALSEMDFPTTRVEAWKYTRVGKIANGNFSLQQPTGKAAEIAEANKIEGLDAYTVVLENGFLLKSDIPNQLAGVITNVAKLPDAFLEKIEKAPQSIFDALHANYTTGGVCITTEKNQQIDKPIHIIHSTTADHVLAQPHHIVLAEQGSKVEVIISNATGKENTVFHNGRLDVLVAENANVNIDVLQINGEAAYHLDTQNVWQESNSNFSINTLTMSGAWTRNNLNIAVDGQNCQTDLYGTYMPTGKEHVDNHTIVDHLIPNCESNEVYKGIIYDKATGVFNGKVFVRPDAQKTNAYQQNANILMTDDATMNSKPELEIYADDVKCSHGSTTGQFDEEAVFYLKARGIDDAAARKLLVGAFVGDIVNHVHHDSVRDYLLQRIEG